MTVTELVKVRDAVSQISKGKDVNEDIWMVMWSNSNWGNLLQPAPLSIALLGSLMIIASSTSDFSLISEHTSVKFAYARYPTSFKTCLQQMVGDGYTAFETASQQMARVNNASSQLPATIKRAVAIVIQNTSPKDIEYLLPIELDSISELTNICINASQTCEKEFAKISALAQEILECATYKIGSVEQAKERNEMLLSILQQQAKEEKQMVEEAQRTSDLMKESFTKAEEQFKTAVDNVPSGMTTLAMHVVESLTKAVTAPMNALFLMANVKGNYLQTGRSQAQGTTTRPSGATLSDPGISAAQQILVLVTSLDHLISGGPNGKPDWNHIRVSEDKSGSLYVQRSLKTLKGRLDGTRPISKELLPIVRQAIEVAKNVNATAKSTKTNNEAFDHYKSSAKKMIADLRAIVTRCNLILQQTGHSATGPGTPKHVPTRVSSTRAAIETAKFSVDQTRANLEAARKSYDNASARLIEDQREITKTIGEMTRLRPGEATLEEIVPMLMQTVKTFTTLRAQFSQMTEFFCSVASIVNDVMKPQVAYWVKNMQANSRLSPLAGVTLSGWYRHVIYEQLMGPLRVSKLAERISSTYLHVSELYIMPAQREVGHLLQFQEDTSEKGTREFLSKLTRAQASVHERSQEASEKILELIMSDQKEFVDKINERLATIQGTVGQALPETMGPVPRHITDVTDAHVKELDRHREAVKIAIPPYQVDELVMT